MLEALCGNKSVQQILIFIFVNGRCYGNQLHRALKTPLTPIQKALNRLEKGGLITSYYEGKTRLYEFNPAYPLITELELLIKKAYTLLSNDKKREYYVPKKDLTYTAFSEENKISILLDFWKKLSNVKSLSFTTKTKSSEILGWKVSGKGEVTVIKSDRDTLIFNEKGVWENKEKTEVNFSNVFRWTLDRSARVVSLEHLRRGKEHPVFLFHLTPSSKQSLSSIDSHLCDKDTYFGQIRFNPNSLHFNWRIIGPRKNEEIDYHYY